MKPHDTPQDAGNQNRRGFLETGAASAIEANTVFRLLTPLRSVPIVATLQ
jgi:hypothetical protein